MPLPASTAAVTRQTLTQEKNLSGKIGFGRTRPLVSQVVGTFTWLPEPGTTVGLGQQLFRVDDLPVLELWGTLPVYRAMFEGMSGADVAQLNVSLRWLGVLRVDPKDTFTSATSAAVKRWQKRVGLAPTGVVDLGRVVFTSAPVRVASVHPQLGDAASAGSNAIE
ncbi:MAG TPA: peptidoglycan-binding domain-containing protein, partial [Acidimicrobiales bacterium]